MAFGLWSYVFRSFGILCVLLDKVFDQYVGGRIGELLILQISEILFLIFAVDYMEERNRRTFQLLKMWNTLGLNC